MPLAIPNRIVTRLMQTTPKHALDNVIWQALTTRQAHFAERSGEAGRFLSDITSLCAFAEPSASGYASLAALVSTGGTAALFLDEKYEPRTGWTVVAEAPLMQMICENPSDAAPSSSDQLIELGPPDSHDMLELTALTKPGPFGNRTHELGFYAGIRVNGRLIAMAGERLKVPGHTEVSAVCTHPDHTGKGYARALMMEIMRSIRERGETPFLHVRQDNTRAIELYKRLGFRERRVLHLAVLRNQ
jgi:predicted GNAT family acetyltransferase